MDRQEKNQCHSKEKKNIQNRQWWSLTLLFAILIIICESSYVLYVEKLYSRRKPEEETPNMTVRNGNARFLARAGRSDFISKLIVLLLALLIFLEYFHAQLMMQFFCYFTFNFYCTIILLNVRKNDEHHDS